jgi:hypothetical protein
MGACHDGTLFPDELASHHRARGQEMTDHQYIFDPTTAILSVFLSSALGAAGSGQGPGGA